MAALEIHVDTDIERRPRVRRLLDQASAILCRDPALGRQLPDGTICLECPLPHGYRRTMNHWATSLQARITREGWMFEISEVSRGISGGYMASCIPPKLYIAFLSAWVAHAGAPRQRELFA